MTINNWRIAEIELRRLNLPLVVPYRLSYRTFEAFEPILVRVRDQDGRTGFGEGHISPGSSSETRAGSWSFCREQAARLVGRAGDEALHALSKVITQSPVAASAMMTALEMLDGHAALQVQEETRLPLLTPTNGVTPNELLTEVEQRLQEGFRTFKIKVGQNVDADLARVAVIQSAVAGRASLRIDANRAYRREDACRFVAGLQPDGVELFEQPCAAEDWEANARVAQESPVPIMLDEPICTPADIDRAAEIPGVGFCKVKLKRFGSLTLLGEALHRIRDAGMKPVLGDGLSSEPACWMEACVARATIDNAGEFNGFLKPRARLFRQPLRFESGCVVLEAGECPGLDSDTVARHTTEAVRFDSS